MTALELAQRLIERVRLVGHDLPVMLDGSEADDVLWSLVDVQLDSVVHPKRVVIHGGIDSCEK